MSIASNEPYVNEKYKFGDKEKEVKEFKDHVRRVLEAQKKIAKEHSSDNPKRVFHAKSHGCLKGKLILLDSRTEATRHGIFSSGGKQSYNVLARFSNGVGHEQHDLIPDVRGVALKIFGVADRSLTGGGNGSTTVDFLMTNSTNPFGDDQEEFVQFMEANLNRGVVGQNLLRFVAEHLEVFKLLLKATLPISSLVTQQYWSGHAYLLGPSQAMKLNISPSDDTGSQMLDSDLQAEVDERAAKADSSDDSIISRVTTWFDMFDIEDSKLNADYLSHDLMERARRGPIKFVLSVQLEKDPEVTPIEHGLMEWKEEDSPSIPIAELVLERQETFQDCTNLRFTPGHYIAAHRPLGNIGRGRVFTYEASQVGRGADAAEPEESSVFGDETS